MKLTINFFSVRRKMKSLSILLVFFATTLAIRISEYHPNDTIVSITEGETLKLSCKWDKLIAWDSCEFTHGNKSCKTFWSSAYYSEKCKNGKNGIGKMYRKDGSCIFEVMDLKKEGAGNWTCKLSDLPDINSEPATHIFVVEVQDKPPATKTNSSTATRPTEFMTFSILAFTFFIVF